MAYSVSSKHYMGNAATIVSFDGEGNEIPVVNFITVNGEFPADMGKLAANLASAMNGNTPLHKVDLGSKALFWAPNGSGATLHLQKTGVSKPGLILSALDDTARSLLKDAEFMAGFCCSVQPQYPAHAMAQKPQQPHA